MKNFQRYKFFCKALTIVLHIFLFGIKSVILGPCVLTTQSQQKHIFYRVNIFTAKLDRFLGVWLYSPMGRFQMVWDGSMMNDPCVKTDLCLS